MIVLRTIVKKGVKKFEIFIAHRFVLAVKYFCRWNEYVKIAGLKSNRELVVICRMSYAFKSVIASHKKIAFQ